MTTEEIELHFASESRARARLAGLLGHPVEFPIEFVSHGVRIRLVSCGYLYTNGEFRCVRPSGIIPIGLWTRLLTLYLYAKHDFDYLNEKAN